MNTPLRNALLSGLVFPGVGQYANKHWLKGSVFVLLALATAAGLCWQLVHLFAYYMAALKEITDVTAVPSGQILNKNIMFEILMALLMWVGALVIIWIASSADAYYAAKKIERSEAGAANHKGGFNQ